MAEKKKKQKRGKYFFTVLYLPHAVTGTVPLHQKTALAHTQTHTASHGDKRALFLVLLLSNFLINT